jgi:hypothetical protein
MCPPFNHIYTGDIQGLNTSKQMYAIFMHGTDIYEICMRTRDIHEI